jgi:hypothetical protein
MGGTLQNYYTWRFGTRRVFPLLVFSRPVQPHNQVFLAIIGTYESFGSGIGAL